jgi:SAM-dependent methyltransferase
VSACRLCGAPLEHVVADLGVSPVSNDFLREEDLGRMEPFYPLCALVCEVCLLVQLEAFEPPEKIFSDDYAYFSSFSTGWLDHARRYTDAIVERLGLGAESKVVEIASNDGYLLQYFVARGIPVLGVEPTANTAAAAIAKGVPTEVRFFGSETAADLHRAGHAADLLIANNVLAHVPDLNDFVEGLSLLLAPEGVLTIEFPHLLRLLEEAQFDTIYHEHYSYFSLLTASRALERHGLAIFDVEEVPTHGGSLRIYAGHAPGALIWQNEWSRPEPPVVSDLGATPRGEPGERVRELRERERAAGLEELPTYLAFAERVRREKREIVRFFIEQKEAGVSIAGYGAPAKGNTLLNYCGIGRDFIDYTVDLNPHKQGRYLPGTHIPIRDPDEIRRTQPALVFILPWNLREEVIEQLAFVREWGGRFAARSPSIRIFP